MPAEGAARPGFPDTVVSGPPAPRPQAPRERRLRRVPTARDPRYGRRVAAGDPEDLTVMLACHKAMGEAITAAIRTARAELGWTWADIGRAAADPTRPSGISRSAAHERWGGV